MNSTQYYADPFAEVAFIGTVRSIDGLDNATVTVTDVFDLEPLIQVIDRRLEMSTLATKIVTRRILMNYTVDIDTVTVDAALMLSDDNVTVLNGTGAEGGRDGGIVDDDLTTGDAAVERLIENIRESVASGFFSSILRGIAGSMNSTSFQNAAPASTFDVTASEVTTQAFIPHPTSAPTFLYSDEGTVPLIRSITISPRSFNATISVSMEQNDPTAERTGTAYCSTRLTTQSAPENVGQIRSSGVSRAYTSLSKPLSLTVDGLAPLEEYNLYCALVSTTGRESAIADVLAKASGFETTCCKQVAFTAVPTSVYTDLSVYPPSSTAFMFFFDASDLPSDSVVVSVQVVDVDGIVIDTSNFQSYPVSFKYDRSTGSADLTRQFFFVGEESLAGTYTASLVIDGPSASEYEADSGVAFTVLSTSSPLLAPSLESVRFGNSGANMFIVFRGETDFGRLAAATFTCTELFDFAGANRSSCSWLDTTTVEATFPTYTSSLLASPGDLVTLRSGKVRSACQNADPLDAACDDNELAPQQAVESLTPRSPALPAVVLNGATLASTCEDLLVSICTYIYI
jgi:hypothetical protein